MTTISAGSAARPRLIYRLGPFGICFALAVGLHGLFMWIDHVPRFFLGDSASYLYTEIGGFVPHDRSWIYGLAINPLIDATGSLVAVLVLQALLGALACALAGTMVESIFGRSRPAALLVTGALSLEPLLLFYERAIMTEVPALAGWMALVLLCSLMVVRPRPSLAVGAALAAVLAVGLRTVFLPAVVGAAALLALHAVRLTWQRRWPHAAAAALVPVLTGGALVAYAFLTGSLTGRDPAVNPNSGFFLIGAVAPMLDPEDFRSLGMEEPAAMLRDSRAGTRWLRNAQIWGDEGLASRIKAQASDPERANDVATVASLRALRSDPGDFLHLASLQLREYLDPAVSMNSVDEWAGLDRDLDAELREQLFLRTGDRPAPDAPSRPSPVLSWVKTTSWWPAVAVALAIAVSAVSLVTAVLRRGYTAPPLALVSLLCLGYLAATISLSAYAIPRYLLPAIPLLAIQLSVLPALLTGRGGASPSGRHRESAPTGRGT